MKPSRRICLAVLLGLAGSTAAQMHVARQSYYPVIRVSTTEGVTYTTLLEPAAERSRCATASKVFLASLKEQCPECDVHFARCERAPGHPGEEGPLQVPHQVFSVPGLRIDVAGPAASARRGCELIARDFARRGLPSAACSPLASAATGL